MKYFIVCFMAVFVLLGCESKKENQVIDFSGNWISKDYLDALEAKKSPKNVSDNLVFYATELVINPKNGDSVVVYNGQMERASLPFSKTGDGLRIKLNQDKATDLLYSQENKTLYFVDSTLNRIFSFVRVDSTLLDKSYEMPIAFPTQVNEVTMTGKFQLYEHNGTQKVIQFGKFGTITGWDKYDNYMVVVNGDLATNEETDMLVLSKGNKLADLKGLRMKGDTTVIFDLKANFQKAKMTYKNTQPMALLVKIK